MNQVVAWHAIVLDDCLMMNNGSVGTKNVPIFWAQNGPGNEARASVRPDFLGETIVFCVQEGSGEPQFCGQNLGAFMGTFLNKN